MPIRFLLSVSIAAIGATGLLTGCASTLSAQQIPRQLASAGRAQSAPPTSCVTTACFYVGNLSGNRLGSVTAYAAQTNGNVPPIQTVSGSNTGLAENSHIALDGRRDIYVATGTGSASRVLVFAPGANGNVAPIRRIQGSNTGLNTPYGIALDSSRNVYVANDVLGGSVTVYAAGAHGNVAPIQTISGPNTGLGGPTGIALDASRNIYVTAFTGGGNPAVLVFAAGASGNVAPIQTISGSNTGLNDSFAIALDSIGDTYVANYYGGFNYGSVTVYAAGANGNVAPIQAIFGSRTHISFPTGIAFHGRRIYVANENCASSGCPSTVTVFPPTANGNVAPLREIGGSRTGLSDASAVAVR